MNCPLRPEGRAVGGEEVLLVPEQRCPCGPFRVPNGAGGVLQLLERPHDGVGIHTAGPGEPQAESTRIHSCAGGYSLNIPWIYHGSWNPW